LVEVLEESRHRGLLGPGPVGAHIEHARGFARALREITHNPTPPATALDLGSGGGLPGLVLLFEWPGTEFVWLDATARSIEFLEFAAARLEVTGRVHVVRGRAEEVARSPVWRARLEVVVARSFSRPAATAECGAAFLVPGGHLVVSEPPAESPGRWDEEGLALLGLELAGHWQDGANYQVLCQVARCPERFPRRSGRPEKRPLF